METNSEKTIERHLVEEVARLGGFALKLTAQYHTGIPDRLVLLPGGQAIFVELKSTGCTPTKLQQAEMARLRKIGFACYVVDSPGGVDALIDLIKDADI